MDQMGEDIGNGVSHSINKFVHGTTERENEVCRLRTI